ncbi:MAG: DUF2971 domain-containing protein [Prevotella sp.]|nr:DUF2971 domain-containing protein [Prevotella sp.]
MSAITCEMENEINELLNLPIKPHLSQIYAGLEKYRLYWSYLPKETHSKVITTMMSVCWTLGVTLENLDYIKHIAGPLENSMNEFCKLYGNDSERDSKWYSALIYANFSIIASEFNPLASKKFLFYLMLSGKSKNNENWSDRNLYCFRKCDKYFIGDLKDNVLTLSDPANFNDPMDCLMFPWIEYMKKEKDEEIRMKQLEETCRSVRIRCFVCYDHPSEGNSNNAVSKNGGSEVCNTLMWSHYADSHKGICVKYKFPKDFPKDDKENMIISRWRGIKYDDEQTVDKMSFIDAFFGKAKTWEYENEVRLVYYDPSTKCEYTRLHLPLGCVEAVYFGVKCPEGCIQYVREAVKGQGVKLYKMETDSRYLLKLTCKQLP